MAPLSIRLKLASLGFRERLLRFVWGAARVAAVFVAALAFACLIDWVVDRFQETPFNARVCLLLAQVAGWAAALFYFVVRPLSARFTHSRLALMVEDKYPQLDHRLISTVELNQRGAKIAGMSRELIQMTTEQTLEATKRLNFSRVADHGRLKWAAVTLLPTLAVVALAVLLMPETLAALLQRQLLADVDIPRNVRLANATRPIWPAGDEVQLVYSVSFKDGAPRDDLEGDVRVYPDGQSRERYPLKFQAFDTADPAKAIYTVMVPPSTVDFNFHARLGDGRTAKSSRIHFVPRPAIVKHDAWLILPDYLGKRTLSEKDAFDLSVSTLGLPAAAGGPWPLAASALLVGAEDVQPNYELEMKHGEIVSPPGLPPRVLVTFQKPIKKASLILLQNRGLYPEAVAASVGLAVPPSPDFAVSVGLTHKLSPAFAAPLIGPRPDSVRRVLEQDFPEAVTEAEWTFDLRPTETEYRVAVLDEYGFANTNPGARSISLVPERPPQVKFLVTDDSEVDGVFIPFQVRYNRPGPVRIAYEANGVFGLSRAFVKYRVIKKNDKGEDPNNQGEEKWRTLPMIEVKETAKTGRFNLRIGAFENSDEDDQVPFHAMAFRDPDGKTLPRSLGGGRWDLQTAGLVDDDGKPANLKVGDQVEYFVEVESRLTPGVLGRSETRTRTIVSEEDFGRWITATTQEESRIRSIERSSRAVIAPK